MNDRNVSRKTHYGYSGATGYGKSYGKDGRGYNGRNTGPSSLIQAAPKKKVQLRPVQLPSHTTEKTTGILSSSTAGGWAKKDDRNGPTIKSGEKAQNRAATLPWSSQRGVPGLNQPEPSRTEFTELGNRNGNRRSEPDRAASNQIEPERKSDLVPKKQNPMLPNYMKPPEEQSRNKSDSTSSGNENEKPKNDIESKHNGSASHPRDEPPPPQKEEPIRIEESDDVTNQNRESDNDGFDPMESWADDKPVNWNEKIVFSDEDQPVKTPTPPNDDQEPSNDYDSRYDNHRYEDTRYDRNRSYNRNYDSRDDSSGYDRSRGERGADRNGPTYRYEPPGARAGFYDDNERGYYEKDLEKTRDHHTGENLFSSRPREPSNQNHRNRNGSESSRSYNRDDSASVSRDRNRERRNSRRHEENHEDKNEANESEDNGGLLELLEDPVEEVMPRRKVVRKPKAMLLRDFNHEEKGEEIDDLEPKMEEKEKVTKPRGWNKESVGKDDPNQKPKKENPKKKKSQNLEKNEKSGKNPKLPTADGSRQSRLDKENAEKEVANKNVWAERMSKQKKEDTDNDRVFVPGAHDMKRTLGDTGMTLKASKPIREPSGPSYGRGDRSDQSDSKSRDRKGARRDQVDRNQSESKKDSRNERYDRHDRNNRNNHRDQPDTRRDDQKREKRKHKNDERYENDRNMDHSRGSHMTAPSPAAGSNNTDQDQIVSNRNEADRAGQTVQPPKKTLEFVAAEPPRTNIWAERIKQQQKTEEQKTRTRDHHADGNRDHHDNRTNQSDRANKNDFFASKKEKDSGRKRSDRNRDQRKSRDTDHGSDVGGSKGNLAKFRENEKRKNEKRDFSGSNENVSRAPKKRDQKKGGSNQRLNRLESKDEDEAPSKKPRRREDDSKPKKKESGSSTEDVTGQRSSMMGRTSVRSKTGLSERAGKRRNERSKRQERFKNAYEFPKPADDIKDAQVPNVDAIRGGLSFRGLMRQRAGATCTLRGSRTDMRNRSSDQSTNQEDGIENENNQSEEIFNRKNDGEKKSEEDHKNLSNQKIDQKLNESLNVNAVEFNSSPSSHKVTSQSNHFSPNSSAGSNLATSGGHFPEPEVTGISFIALPSPNQNNASMRSPAANPPIGIYGDTSSNSPQLVRVEDQSSSPIHIEESTLKKMERSRKAWDNAPISSGVGFNGFQPTPGQNAPTNQKQASQGAIIEVDTPTQQTSKDVQNTSFEVSPSQPIISSEPVTANNWGSNQTNQNASSEWSKDAGGSGTISGANWGKSGQQSATDQWKKEQMPLQPQMNDVNQLQGIGPNPGLTNQINQMGAYSRQNQFPGTQAAGLGDMGALATNQLNAHLINNAAASYPGSNQQPSANQLSYPNFNNQNLFYNSQHTQVAYNPNTLIQPNQLNNAFEFGGQQNLYSNQLGSSSFNSNIYGNDQRQSDFGFNNAYPGFDNTMLANLQRQTQSSNVLNFPQTSNGMNRYQNNITPGAFNLGMGAQQTQRPDMTAPNLRPNIGNPHHSSNLFGKSPSPSPASLTKLMGGNHFGSDFPFNQSANIPSFRLKTQTRSNSVTPPHHQRTSKRNDFNSFNMNGRGFDSSFESQKSYMSGNGNEFDPKMNQFMNRTNQNTNPQGSFDPVNAYFKQQGNSFGPFGAGGAGAGGGTFMNHGASGRNSRNGNNSNPSRGNNGNNVIGKFGGMDKNFTSGPVGSKLDQKGIIQDGRNLKGQKKNMNKDFLPSQKERNEGKQALISQVSELTNKFSAVGLEKGSSEPSPTSTPGGQQQQVAPPNGGQSASSPTDQQQGHAADNIVLSVDDRKRLTLADTAPKGGGIRRIIAQERS